MWQRLIRLNPIAKLAIGGLTVLVLLTIGYRFGAAVSLGRGSGTISVSDADVCLREGGNVYFNVTYGTEDYLKRLGEWDAVKSRMGMARVFVISGTTHVGSIKDLSLSGRVFLRTPDGATYPAVDRPVMSSTHHDTWLVFFPRYDMQGQSLFEQESGSFDILIQDVDIFPERVFTFHHPLPVAGQSSRLDLTRLAMLVGAAMAAMLVSCTPCLVGSMTVGSLTMGTAWAPSQRKAAGEVRAEMIRRTVYYLAALVVMYISIAVVINTFNISTASLRPVELVGGAVLLVIGLGFLRSSSPVARLERAVVGALRTVAGRDALQEQPASPRVGPDTSSAMGASLALVCSVAGAPTLSTAIIVPVMIYAGLNDLYWSMLILGIYLVVCAIPFFLIAVGLGEFLYTASLRMRNVLVLGNAALLIGLGLLLMLDPQSVADALSLPARILLEPFRWLL